MYEHVWMFMCVCMHACIFFLVCSSLCVYIIFYFYAYLQWMTSLMSRFALLIAYHC